MSTPSTPAFPSSVAMFTTEKATPPSTLRTDSNDTDYQDTVYSIEKVTRPPTLRTESSDTDYKDTLTLSGTHTSAQEVEDNFPDGGVRAWTVLIGTMFCTFSTFGLINSWGVFQSYYEQTILKDQSPSNIAWIGSIQYAFVFFPGLVIGRYFDMGFFRLPFMLASALLVISTFLVAECTEYWQFLLCQGVANGLAAGVMYGPITGIIGHWFKKRLGLALGLNAVGASLGGTVLPIVARKLIPLVGFPWMMRILGFILLAAVAVANLTMRPRLAPKHVTGGIISLSMFSPAYTVYCISSFLGYAGAFTVLTYIDVGATEIGVSPDFTFYLVSMANASGCLGRFIGGVLIDQFGAINTLAPFAAGVAMITYLWPYAQTTETIIAVAVIYGFLCGGYSSALLAPVYSLGDLGDVGRRSGMTMAFMGMGALVGSPISGAINNASGSFKPVGYYAGTVTLLSISMMLLARHLILRSIYGRF